MEGNKAKLSVGELLIDLTPLLDVIFILLCAILVINKPKPELENQLDEANQQNASLQSQLNNVQNDLNNANAAQGQLENINYYEEFYTIVNVYAFYKPENRIFRQIDIMVNNVKLDPIQIQGNNNLDKAWDEFKTKIEEIVDKSISENKEKIFLTINRNRDDFMLWRDERKIEEIFDEIIDSKNSDKLEKSTNIGADDE